MVTCLDFVERVKAMANSHGTFGVLRGFFNPTNADRIYDVALIQFVEWLARKKDLTMLVEMGVLSLRFLGIWLSHDVPFRINEDLWKGYNVRDSQMRE